MLVPCAYALLVKTILASFPRSIDIDYFELCGVPKTDAFISDETHDVFRSINSLLQMMESHQIVTLDRFFDGTDEFFWNVRATLAGHSCLSKLEEASLSAITAQQIAESILNTTA